MAERHVDLRGRGRCMRCAAILPLWFPRVNEIIRLIGSHNLLATPTGGADGRSGLRPLIDRYLPGAKGMPAEERIRIFRLAWDFAGSALASRNEQYERFYIGSAPLVPRATPCRARARPPPGRPLRQGRAVRRLTVLMPFTPRSTPAGGRRGARPFPGRRS